jgi:sugar (pentulose or hexulose) kinase
LLGIDVGTSSVKVGLFSPDGAALDRYRTAQTIRSPRPGYLELDAEEVWTAIVDGTRALLSRTENARIEGVGVAAASPSALVADSAGRVVSPVCTFADTRAAAELDKLSEQLGPQRFQAMTGNPLAIATCSILTAQHLAGTVGAEGGLRFGHLGTFIVHRLTGRWVMDPTNAAYTGALGLANPHEWSSEAIAALGISPTFLPELVSSTEPVGTVTAEARTQLGLATSPLVTAGIADTAAAALAVGCVDDGDAFESIGTSGVLSVCRSEPVAVAHAMTRPHVVADRWLSHAAMSSSGASMSWVADRVLRGASGEGNLSALNELAASAPPGSGGVIFLPYLAGERSPVWDASARGAWVGMTLDTSAAHLARAVFEGSAYGLRQLIELEVASSGNQLRELMTVGGGTNSAFWSTVKADVTGRVFHRAHEGDVGVRGAALMAATVAGLHESPLAAARAAVAVPTSPVEPTRDERTRAVYDEMYAVYQRLYPALRPLFPLLRDAAAPTTSEVPAQLASAYDPERNSRGRTA